MNYYIIQSEEEAGPFTFEQLRSMWHAGQITSTTLYWREGMADWESLSNFAADLDIVASPLHSRQMTPQRPSAPAANPVLPTVAVPNTPNSNSIETALLFMFLAVVVLALGGAGFYAYVNYQKHKVTERDEGIADLSSNLKEIAAEKNIAAIKTNMVRISMSKSDVIRSIGTPQNRERVTNEAMRQTAEEQWTYENPTVSLVYFGYDGRVVYCTKEIDFDMK